MMLDDFVLPVTFSRLRVATLIVRRKDRFASPLSSELLIATSILAIRDLGNRSLDLGALFATSFAPVPSIHIQFEGLRGLKF
jgi:hypothetical protein